MDMVSTLQSDQRSYNIAAKVAHVAKKPIQMPRRTEQCYERQFCV